VLKDFHIIVGLLNINIVKNVKIEKDHITHKVWNGEDWKGEPQ